MLAVCVLSPAAHGITAVSLSLSDRRIESGQAKRKRGRAAGISPPYFILTDRLQHPFKNFICTFAITGNTVCSTALNVHKIRLQVKCAITNVHNKNTNNQNKVNIGDFTHFSF